MNAKWIIATVSVSVTVLSLLFHWAFMEIEVWQALALLFSVAGLIWLAIPIQLKQPLEAILADPRWADCDWPDEWSDFVACSAMLISSVIVWL